VTHLSLVPSFATVFVVIYLTGAAAAALHALLTKPDPRSALCWIAVCWIFPLVGSVLYWLLGVNLVRRRGNPPRARPPVEAPQLPSSAESHSLAALALAGDALTQCRIVDGNVLEPLHEGEVAFPRMLQAIDAAAHTVWLATYIFQTDETGRRFVSALQAAVARGVQVRALVDGIGEWYSWPHVVPLLRRAGVPAARFLPPRLFPPNLSLNCRNHRKILVVDGREAFIGGMNLGGREIAGSTGRRMADIHFSLQGPIVRQLAVAFTDDWQFVCGENLQIPAATRAAGAARCRVVTGGPADDADKLLLLILAAISIAQRQILIMTPYFIPPTELVAALQAAALRGVEVSIVVPRHSNLNYIDWATLHWLPPLIARGVRVHLQEPPFSHAKLLVIDGQYAQIGSVNVDTRSLRLNCEIAVEVFDTALCAALVAVIETAASTAAPLKPGSLDEGSMITRIRNSLAWLISPYL
jgi:cardiolipin synthase A/B